MCLGVLLRPPPPKKNHKIKKCENKILVQSDIFKMEKQQVHTHTHTYIYIYIVRYIESVYTIYMKSSTEHLLVQGLGYRLRYSKKYGKLVWFYGISIIEGYLMSNPILYI